MLSSDQSTTGAGREDQSLFRFDYEENIFDDILSETEPEAVAPARLRGEDIQKLVDQVQQSNVTEAPLANPEVSTIFKINN